VINYDNKLIEIEKMSVLLVTGIASPTALENHVSTLAKHCISLHFSDHHNYNFADLSKIKKMYDAIDGDQKIILTTEKDAARLLFFKNWFMDNNLALFVQPIQVVIIDNSLEFENELCNFVNNFPTFTNP
jgi:tetraacyldisaccharide 4'-kinase